MKNCNLTYLDTEVKVDFRLTHLYCLVLRMRMCCY